MSTSPHYEEILDHFGQLSTADQFQLLEDLVALLGKQVMARPSQPRHSIMELRGLGKEIWGRDRRPGIRQPGASIMEWLKKAKRKKRS